MDVLAVKEGNEAAALQEPNMLISSPTSSNKIAAKVQLIIIIYFLAFQDSADVQWVFALGML